MRFLLAFALIFVSVFASAQVPMVLGGPQGIDVTRILARNWMSIPIYIDTPAAPLTGSGWPGKGYIIQVAKAGDTSVWQYTGQRWAKIAGASQETYTKLVTGGDVNQLGLSRQYTVSPSTYYINGVFYNLNTQQTVTSPVKTANANARIDVIALTTTGATVVQGTERPVPLKPSVGPNRLELAAIYYPAFDTVSREISEGGLTSVYRILGRDSIYFTSGDSVISVKDSIGISKNDTAAMLNAYKFTAANGLTKDSTVFRLGGSLNQNTNINLNTRRLTIIGGNDTTRFFSGGQVSIGGTPDSNTVHYFVNNKNTRLGALEILAGSNAGITGQGIRIDGVDNSFRFQGSGQSGVPATFIFEGWQTDTVPANAGSPGLSKDIMRISQGFRRNLGVPAIDTGRFNILHVRPKLDIRYDSGHTVVRGIYYNPIIQNLNKTTHIAYQNTTGNNLLNSTSGNTRIGYNTSDTTYKLDVNGTVRTNRISPYRNGNIAIGDFSSNGTWSQAGAIAIGYEALGNGTGDCFGTTAIGSFALRSGNTGNYNTAIGHNSLANGGGFGYNTVIGSNSVTNLDNNSQFYHNAILGSEVVALNKNAQYSIALGSGRRITNSRQFVAGGDNNDPNRPVVINDVYFGSGVQGDATTTNPGASYTINGSGGFGSNQAGGNITIAGGKGTGNATPGAVIFSISTRLPNAADTTTLQALTERARISERGNLLVGTATDDTSSLVNIVSTAKGFLQPRMTNTQRDAITTPATGLQLFSTTDSANYVYRGTGGGWQKIANEISGSDTLDFPSTNNGNKSDLTINGITGAEEGDVVALGIPNSVNLNHSCFTAWVSASGQVTIRFSNYGTGSLDPVSATFKVKVFK